MVHNYCDMLYTVTGWLWKHCQHLDVFIAVTHWRISGTTDDWLCVSVCLCLCDRETKRNVFHSFSVKLQVVLFYFLGFKISLFFTPQKIFLVGFRCLFVCASVCVCVCVCVVLCCVVCGALSSYM